MDEVIVEQIVESHPDGLKIMYANKLLEFVPHHCRLLREVTGGAISRGIEARLSHHLTPGMNQRGGLLIRARLPEAR
ncbi:conserved oligomeric Golgi complex subunit 2-like isoform X4 [Mustela lutreola]|uniref:conserved oligomeric Golgi complex subunit 2-like isoform X4 n=1 Tax=Mustela lutreola TaxID=9666 RepID=UPI0027977EC0|nr:conserved oligomeric Golgi complex subunit 2-like isoform X4 [Mustela lutreola]